MMITELNNGTYDKTLAFKDNAPFTSCILKINNTLIDNARNLDIVMSMYNLLEYSKNYSKTIRSFWNYYRDEPDKYKLFHYEFKIFRLYNKQYRKTRRQQYRRISSNYCTIETSKQFLENTRCTINEL